MSKIDAENFMDFHNTPLKLKHRTMMLNGEWPGQEDEWGCHYCKEIEKVDGISDRKWHLTVPDMYPPELDQDPTAIVVKPVVVELFLNNTCQMSCLYCNGKLSSSIEMENKKFNNSVLEGVQFKRLMPSQDHDFKNLLPAFRAWFEKDFRLLRRLNILGGEPFLQKEFDVILDYIDDNPNPDCELNIVSNLMVPKQVLERYVLRLKKMLINRKLKSLQLLASIDAWGPQEEYVRQGLNLEIWEENFRYLLAEPWIKLAFNQVFCPLTIKTAPELMHKLREFRQIRHVGLYSGTISPTPSYFFPWIFGAGVFEQDFKNIIEAMPIDIDEDIVIRDYIAGIGKRIANSQIDLQEVKKMLLYMNEKDRRRGTDWRPLFPWLVEFETMCQSVKVESNVV
jgi:hypothetical protein